MRAWAGLGLGLGPADADADADVGLLGTARIMRGMERDEGLSRTKCMSRRCGCCRRTIIRSSHDAMLDGHLAKDIYF
jgi:hypothetical protein